MSGSCDSGHTGPSCGTGRRDEVTGEVYNPEEGADEEVATYPKSQEQRDNIRAQLTSLAMLNSLDSAVLDKLVDAMMPMQVEKGRVLLQKGDSTTDKFYIVERGTFQGSVIEGAGQTDASLVYQDAGHFGGVSIFHYYPSTSTVTALTEGKLWVLDRQTYRKIVVDFASQRRRIYQSFMTHVPALSSLPLRQQLDLADAFVSKHYNDGDVIVKKDEAAQGIYFVECGSVRCTNSESRDLTVGECFNENSLSALEPLTQYHVSSLGPSKLAFLDRFTYQRLL